MKNPSSENISVNEICKHNNRMRFCPICFPILCPVCGSSKLEGYTEERINGDKKWLEYWTRCLNCNQSFDDFNINDGLYAWNHLPKHRI